MSDPKDQPKDQPKAKKDKDFTADLDKKIDEILEGLRARVAQADTVLAELTTLHERAQALGSTEESAAADAAKETERKALIAELTEIRDALRTELERIQQVGHLAVGELKVEQTIPPQPLPPQRRRDGNPAQIIAEMFRRIALTTGHNPDTVYRQADGADLLAQLEQF